MSPDGSTVAFLRSDPDDDDAPHRLCRCRPAADGPTWRPVGANPGFGAHRRDRVVTRWPSPGVHRRGRPAALHRRQAPRSNRLGRGAALTADADALARSPGPTGAGTTEGHRDRWSHLFVIDRPRGRPRQVTSGDWGVNDIAWHPMAGPSRSRDPGPSRTSPRPADLGRRRGRPPARRHAGRRSSPRRAGPTTPRAPPTAAGSRRSASSNRSRSTTSVRASSSARPTASRPPVALAPDLDRPIGNWVDTDLNGWMVSGRHGPFWLDDATLLATITDRGRSHPRPLPVRSDHRPPRRQPAHAPPTRRPRPVVGSHDPHRRGLPDRGDRRARHARHPRGRWS